jgi:cyclomaltodextrinase
VANLKMRRSKPNTAYRALTTGILLLSCCLTGYPQSSRDVSEAAARSIRPWVRDAIIYEVFPRAFSEDGNFAGVTRQLDRLRDLGVSILWLMPIHAMGQQKKKGTIGSPYAVRDYYSINPAYGTKEDLKRLVNEAHKRGLKVIIDIVANHTSWDSVLMKHPEFYKHDAHGKIIWPYDWTDVAWLNYDNAKLRGYMIEMLKYWIRKFDLDGFRCDVAGEVPVDFWEHARSEIEKVKPDVLFIAEASKPDLLVKAFDLDYAWPLHSTLTNVIIGRTDAAAIRETWEKERSKFPRGAVHMVFSDDHDESRAIARFGERGALAASALVFTLDGVPLLYNGMEVGDTTESGVPALFERLPIFWPIAERRPQFPEFYKQLTSLRRENPALRDGETRWLRNSDDQRIVTFSRRDSREELVVAVNLSNRPFAGTVGVAEASLYKDVTPDSMAKDRSSILPEMRLDSWGFRIFRRSL